MNYQSKQGGAIPVIAGINESASTAAVAKAMNPVADGTKSTSIASGKQPDIVESQAKMFCEASKSNADTAKAVMTMPMTAGSNPFDSLKGLLVGLPTVSPAQSMKGDKHDDIVAAWERMNGDLMRNGATCRCSGGTLPCCFAFTSYTSMNLNVYCLQAKTTDSEMRSWSTSTMSLGGNFFGFGLNSTSGSISKQSLALVGLRGNSGSFIIPHHSCSFNPGQVDIIKLVKYLLQSAMTGTLPAETGNDLKLITSGSEEEFKEQEKLAKRRATVREKPIPRFPTSLDEMFPSAVFANPSYREDLMNYLKDEEIGINTYRAFFSNPSNTIESAKTAFTAPPPKGLGITKTGHVVYIENEIHNWFLSARNEDL
jgi:hypothetical protein